MGLRDRFNFDDAWRLSEWEKTKAGLNTMLAIEMCNREGTPQEQSARYCALKDKIDELMQLVEQGGYLE